MEPRSVSERLTMDLSLGWGHSDLGQRAIAKARERWLVQHACPAGCGSEEPGKGRWAAGLAHRAAHTQQHTQHDTPASLLDAIVWNRWVEMIKRETFIGCDKQLEFLV